MACVARGSQRLAAAAAAAAASPGGTLLLPLSAAPPAEPSDAAGLPQYITKVLASAGADLITQAPEIRAWLRAVAPGKRLVIGSYAYLVMRCRLTLSNPC